MVRPIWRFLALGLVLLLTACGGSRSEPVQAPVEVQQPPVAEVTQPDSSRVEPGVEESKTTPEIVLEKDAATTGPTPAVGTTPVEEEAVSEAVSSAEPETTPAEPVSIEPETTPAEVASMEPEVETEEGASTEVKAEPDGGVVTRPGPTAEQLELLASLSVKGTPPELNNEVWLNSDPLKLADLRGKVVIVEFWTFG